MQKTGRQHSARRTDRVTMGDGASLDIDDVGWQSKLLHDCKRDCGEGLIDFDPLHVADTPACARQGLFDGGDRPEAEKAWLGKNRETAARFIKATVEAIALIKTNKPVALAAMKKWYGITDPAHQESIYVEAAKLASKPYPNIEGIKAVLPRAAVVHQQDVRLVPARGLAEPPRQGGGVAEPGYRLVRCPRLTVQSGPIRELGEGQGDHDEIRRSQKLC